MEKETLEEFINEELDDVFFTNISKRKEAERLIEIGAKWQQQNSYSDDEVVEFCEWFAFELNHYGYPTNENILKALKQFKKK